MKKFLLLTALATFCITHQLFAQNSCVNMMTQTVTPQQVPGHPNFWVYSYSYQCFNVTNDQKKPIHFFGTVTDPSTNNVYDHCYLVNAGKGEVVTITSDPFFSTTIPVLTWETYTGNDCGLGAVCARQTALPIHFAFFNTTKDENGILLKWSASIENEPYPLIVERSFDGRTFVEIAKLSQTVTSYRDNPQISGGQVFYRISLNNQKSPIAAVWYTAAIRCVPIGKTLQLNMPATARAKVFTAGGAEIISTNERFISLSDQPNGMYILTIYGMTGEVLYTKKIPISGF